MPNASDTQGILRENLIDAGCDPALCLRITELLTEGRRGEAVELLTRHRGKVLENCHREQSRIDCLDYLVFQIEHEKV